MAYSLFVYGTLMLPEVQRAVVGRRFRSVRAVLHGYRRHALRGADYPAIMPEAGASVHGVLLRGISRRVLRILDAYEGSDYVRRRVEVVSERDEPDVTWTYVFAGRRRARLSRHDWRARTILSGQAGTGPSPRPPWAGA